MPVVQVAFDISDDTYKSILGGSLKLMGLVKDDQHRVRKHIPMVKLAKADKVPQTKKVGVWEIVKEHKVDVIGVAAMVVVVGAYAYNSWKKNKIEAAEEKVAHLHKALKEYLKVLKKERLNAKVVDNLLDSIEELEKKKLGKDIELTIPASQLADLLNSIFTYTESLAKANRFEVQVAKPKSGSNGSVTNLKSYLAIQKQILASVA